MTTTISHTWYMTVRHLRYLTRQPVFIVINLVQPAVWLLLYGGLFRRVVEVPGFNAGSYIDFLTPGVVVMTSLWSSAWSGGGIIDDLDRGVIDRFLVTPARRGAIIAGRLIQQALVVVIQALIIVTLGLVVGARFAGGVLGVAVLIATAVLLSLGISSLSNGLALLTRRRQTLLAATQLTVLPLTFVSSVLIQQHLAPPWIQRLAAYNPVNWAVQAGRAALAANPDWALVGSRAGSLACFALVCALLATRAFRTYQRSV